MDTKFVDKMAAAFADELRLIGHQKIAAAAAAAKGSGMLVPGLAAGALGTLALQRVHRDWRMGRAMRMQNQAQGY
jgi:hypothetical protein